MAVQFNVPKSPAKSQLTIDYFKGVDMYNAPANVAIHRSPEAQNMIRDEVGKVRKRMGFATISRFDGRINGSYALNGLRLIHAGTRLYRYDPEQEEETQPQVKGWGLLHEGMADRRSVAIQFSGKLYILDGQEYLVFDGESVAPVSERAYVPTIIISRSPTGGGVMYDPLNLVGTRWTESFLGTAGATAYQLTTAGLDDTPVTAQVMGSDGAWVDKTEGADFTVNRETGVVTFTVAPGVSPVSGMDNVRITAAKTRQGYSDRVGKCDVAALYGVGGSPDRLFVAGNPDYPNIDYYSQLNDPTYFGDTWYSLIGQDDSAIMGYSVLNNLLAAHKSSGADGRSVVVREGRLVDGKAAFPIVNTLQGEGTICKHAFASLGKEPLFLTRLGVYGITAEELTGERYGQHRSLYISSALEKEPGLSDAYAAIWRDMYWLCVNGRAYIMDGLQKEYQRGAPYSSFQYECYYCTGIDGRVLWEDYFDPGDPREENRTLWFGTGDGRICRFYNNVDAPSSYNDDGAAIDAWWDTADISGALFYKNKTFRYVSVRLAAAVVTGIKIFVQKRGIWSQIFDGGAKARYFDFRHINFAKFTFNTDQTPRTLGGKIKVKKVDKARFRLRNNELNEPFGIYSLALEFTEPGNNYKG